MLLNWQGLLLLFAANRYFFVDATYVFLSSCHLYVNYVPKAHIRAKDD